MDAQQQFTAEQLSEALIEIEAKPAEKHYDVFVSELDPHTRAWARHHRRSLMVVFKAGYIMGLRDGSETETWQGDDG